jgi:hypothetical protein
MAAELRSWLQLRAELEGIERDGDERVNELKKLRGNIDPARVPPPPARWNLQPLPWLSSLEDDQFVISVFYPGESPVLPPELPLDRVDTTYRRMRATTVLYVQSRLIELCPPKGTLTRAQARDELHRQCRQIAAASLGGATRNAAHVPDAGAERLLLTLAHGDLERAAPEKLRHLFRLDRRLAWQLLRALAAQKKKLLDRIDGNELWFPVAVDAPAVETTEPRIIEAHPESLVAGRPKKKRGRPSERETEWSIFLEDRRAQLDAEVEQLNQLEKEPLPYCRLSQSKLAKAVGINPRDLLRLSELHPNDERRSKFKDKLLNPELAATMIRYRLAQAKSSTAQLSRPPLLLPVSKA